MTAPQPHSPAGIDLAAAVHLGEDLPLVLIAWAGQEGQLDADAAVRLAYKLLEMAAAAKAQAAVIRAARQDPEFTDDDAVALLNHISEQM